jgi:hypothetical protein
LGKIIDKYKGEKYMYHSEIEEIFCLTEDNRYKYFLANIRESEQIWGLKDKNVWITIKDSNNNIAMPIWPSYEFAKYCNENQWKEAVPECIDLFEFLEYWLLGMKRDGCRVLIFGDTEGRGISIDSEKVTPSREINNPLSLDTTKSKNFILTFKDDESHAYEENTNKTVVKKITKINNFIFILFLIFSVLSLIFCLIPVFLLAVLFVLAVLFLVGLPVFKVALLVVFLGLVFGFISFLVITSPTLFKQIKSTLIDYSLLSCNKYLLIISSQYYLLFSFIEL